MTDVQSIIDIKNAVPGSRVFPVKDKRPCRPGSWQGYATFNDRQIEIFWKDTTLGVALVVPENMVVIDVDVKNGAPGLENLEDMCLKDASFKKFINSTRCHRTQSGGFHFFAYTDDRRIKNKVAFKNGIDLRSQGLGYVVVPPTDGYEVHQDLPIVPLPEIFYKWYADSEEDASDNGLGAKLELSKVEFIPEGERDSTISRIAAKIAFAGLGEEDLYLFLTFWNNTKCETPLADTVVRKKAEQGVAYYLKTKPRVGL